MVDTGLLTEVPEGDLAEDRANDCGGGDITVFEVCGSVSAELDQEEEMAGDGQVVSRHEVCQCGDYEYSIHPE